MKDTLIERMIDRAVVMEKSDADYKKAAKKMAKNVGKGNDEELIAKYYKNMKNMAKKKKKKKKDSESLDTSNQKTEASLGESSASEKALMELVSASSPHQIIGDLSTVLFNMGLSKTSEKLSDLVFVAKREQ